MTGLAERAVLIIGGAGGMGRELAGILTSAGAHVVVGDIDREALAAVTDMNRKISTREVDATDVVSLRSVTDHVAATLGGLDALVYAAGIVELAPAEDVTEDRWDAILSVNLKGAFFACQAALPYLKRSTRGGRIVTISSIAGRRGYAWTHPYGASKFGLVGLTESLAAEVARDGITVNCICPGTCPTTRMGQDLTRFKAESSGRSEAEVLAELAAAIPAGRWVSERDVAGAALFLLSDEAAFVTGVALEVSGGEGFGIRASIRAPQ